MEKLNKAFRQSIDEGILRMTISSPREKGGTAKIKIRPVLLKGELCYQKEDFINNQVFHSNLNTDELLSNLLEMTEKFRQFNWVTKEKEYTCLISKKGKITLKLSQNKEEITDSMESFSHNRKKKYLLQQGRPVDFLVELGVMTKDGKVKNQRYDKFKQINRFLEFIEDVVEQLPKDREITILDFGCGKSYLTFAIYYYIHQIKELDVRIVGLDLKKDVIRRCNELKDKLNYNKLEFINGDIADYDDMKSVDMVVTLHACDTATDYALKKAVDWGARVILSVPCCQHELNKQIKCETLLPVLKYGLLKERMSALITDGLRASLLEQSGYSVQILEFIDMEHTPKNILIRAVKNNYNSKPSDNKKYEECRDFLNAGLTLEKLLL